MAVDCSRAANCAPTRSRERSGAERLARPDLHRFRASSFIGVPVHHSAGHDGLDELLQLAVARPDQVHRSRQLHRADAVISQLWHSLGFTLLYTVLVTAAIMIVAFPLALLVDRPLRAGRVLPHDLLHASRHRFRRRLDAVDVAAQSRQRRLCAAPPRQRSGRLARRDRSKASGRRWPSSS